MSSHFLIEAIVSRVCEESTNSIMYEAMAAVRLRGALATSATSSEIADVETMRAYEARQSVASHAWFEIFNLRSEIAGDDVSDARYSMECLADLLADCMGSDERKQLGILSERHPHASEVDLRAASVLAVIIDDNFSVEWGDNGHGEYVRHEIESEIAFLRGPKKCSHCGGRGSI